jgi:hypothetical protein
VVPVSTKFAVIKVVKKSTTSSLNSLLMVAGCEGLVLPTLTVPKFILEGLTTSCSTPSPVGVGLAVGVAVDVAVAVAVEVAVEVAVAVAVGVGVTVAVTVAVAV